MHAALAPPPHGRSACEPGPPVSAPWSPSPLREGLDELLHRQRTRPAPGAVSVHGMTDVIDNAHSGMRRPRGRAPRWRDGSMGVRWSAASFMEAEKRYREIMGYHDLGTLKG